MSNVTKRAVMGAEVGLETLIGYKHLADVVTCAVVMLSEDVTGMADKIRRSMQPIHDLYALKDPVTGDYVLARDHQGHEIPGSRIPDPALQRLFNDAVGEILNEEVELAFTPLQMSAFRLNGKLPFGPDVIIRMGPFFDRTMVDVPAGGVPSAFADAKKAEDEGSQEVGDAVAAEGS